MDPLFWLLAANVAVWTGLGAYLALLARNQHGMERRLRQLEMLRDA